MMDLLYRRYASPLSFIQTLIDTNNLHNMTNYMLETEQEEKMWELYTHTAIVHNKSFEEWKKEVTTPSIQKDVGLTPDEVITETKKAEEMLKGFRKE